MSEKNVVAAASYEMFQNMEVYAARAQGKGWGFGTVAEEVGTTLKLLGGIPRLAVDAGGHHGEYTAELRRHFSELEIHIFEPATKNRAKLEDRFRSDRLIVINEVAVSGESGTATLYSNEPGSQLASLSKRQLDHLRMSFDCVETVKTLELVEYWNEVIARRPIDILKLDIEGHELDALEGCGECLDHTSVIQFEFGGCNIDTRTYFRDFWLFFKARGFDLFRIAPLGPHLIANYSETDECFSTTNYVARNRRR